MNTSPAHRAARAYFYAHTSSIHQIVFGIPAGAYGPPPLAWAINDHEEAPIRLVTPGFLRPDKGLEEVLYAVRGLLDRGYHITYHIAGEPQRQFVGQAQYHARMEALIEALSLTSVVHMDTRYLSVAEQAAYIQQAHLGVFAYQDPAHASSGTVPLVMGLGRPVLCTPFEYAKAKAEEGVGVSLTTDFDATSIASGLEEFIHIERYTDLSKAVYGRTRGWRWRAVGAMYEELFRDL